MGVAKRLVETNAQARKLRDDAAYLALGIDYVGPARMAGIPAGHPVRALLERCAQIERDKRHIAALLLEAVPTDEAEKARTEIEKRWPLLKHRCISDLLSSTWADAWVDYLKR